MPIPDDLRDILNIVSRATNSQRAEWVYISNPLSEAESVVLKLGTKGIELARSVDFEGDPSIRVTLLGDGDSPLEGFTVNSWGDDKTNRDWEKIDDLFERARRQALNIDAQIAELKEELKRLE
jgi:hypothetical protein